MVVRLSDVGLDLSNAQSVGGVNHSSSTWTAGSLSSSTGIVISTAADHTHAFTTGSTGSTETKPKNFAINFFIKY